MSMNRKMGTIPQIGIGHCYATDPKPKRTWAPHKVPALTSKLVSLICPAVRKNDSGEPKRLTALAEPKIKFTTR